MKQPNQSYWQSGLIAARWLFLQRQPLNRKTLIRPRSYETLKMTLSDHQKGLFITFIGVMLVVPDSLFVRLISAEPMVTAFWRSAASGSFILIGILIIKGFSGFRNIITMGWIGWLYAVLIGSTAPAFVLAISKTSVANVVFILASMPIFSALFLGAR